MVIFVCVLPLAAQQSAGEPGASVSGSGTTDFIPIWTNSTTLGNSVLFQSGTGAKAKVGIGTTTPASTLDVKGGGTIRGLFSLPAVGTATTSAGFDSQPMKLTSSVFNSGTGTAVAQNFQWQAEPVDNDTSSATGTLNLLFATGSNKLAETGLNIASNGQITFASGQTFPGAGTVTSVGSGLGLTGGPITTSGTLAIDTTVVPQLDAANTFTGNQTVNGNVTATNVTATTTVSGGVVNATTSFDIGGAPFAFGNGGNGNAFLGFAGNFTTTGTDNTASGAGALGADTTGSGIVAYGQAALASNTTGSDNAAFGADALKDNTSGFENTAIGVDALQFNTTGSDLTCTGYACTAGDGLHNATAIGARAMVKVSNALVLGSVAGVNGARATTKVGIGTTSPTNLLTLGQGAGPSIADGWTTYSSRRWKTNIHPLRNPLSKVEQLRGVSYDLKDSGKHEIGVIAEEVGKVVPEVVSYEENGKDARGVDYSRLTALLIEAVKQQQEQIRAQKAQIAQLMSQVKAIQTSLKTNGRSGPEVRAVKTQVPMLQQ
jgi:hypothetical protein